MLVRWWHPPELRAPMRNDPERLAELRRLAILESSAERAYDEITRLLATTLDVPITLVNLLDQERDWFKSRVGIQQTQSPKVTSFCEQFFDSTREVIVVEDTLHDTRFATHPMVVGRPFMYSTTREFLIRFGLRDLTDLPKVEEMAEALGFEVPAGLSQPSQPLQPSLDLDGGVGLENTDPMSPDVPPGEKIH